MNKDPPSDDDDDDDDECNFNIEKEYRDTIKNFLKKMSL